MNNKNISDFKAIYFNGTKINTVYFNNKLVYGRYNVTFENSAYLQGTNISGNSGEQVSFNYNVIVPPSGEDEIYSNEISSPVYLSSDPGD